LNYAQSLELYIGRLSNLNTQTLRYVKHMYYTLNASVNFGKLSVGVTRVLIAVGSVAGVMCL